MSAALPIEVLHQAVLCCTGKLPGRNMPTTNPRVSVTLQPSLDAVLRRMSTLTGQSKSALVADLLESSMPTFERLCVVLEAAQQAKDSMKHVALEGLGEAERKLHEQLGLTMDIFEKDRLPIIDQAESIQRRGKSAALQKGKVLAGAMSQPPYVTRGSGLAKQPKSIQKETNQPVSGGDKTASGKSKRSVKGKS